MGVPVWFEWNGSTVNMFVRGIDVELLVAGDRIPGHGVMIANDPDKRERLGRMLTGLGWMLFSKSLAIIEVTPTNG